MSEPTHQRLRRGALDGAFRVAADQVASGSVPFVVAGVADAQRVIRLEALDRADGPRVGVNQPFLLASITKAVVATLVMQQVERGRLVLRQPIRDWWPPLRDAGATPFTAWHVLTHTSGLDDAGLEALVTRGGGREELLREAMRVGAEAPGARYRYVSSTFDLLVEAVAARDGRPFPTMLAQDLLEPLGMRETGFEPTGTNADRPAPMHQLSASGELRPIDPAIVNGMTALHLAGGGLWSTASDVLRFGRAMLRGGELDGRRVLSPAFVALMTRGTVSGGSEPMAIAETAERYALGWGCAKPDTPLSRAAFGHGGASGTRLWIDPVNDIVIVYLTAVWDLPRWPVDAFVNAVCASLPEVDGR